MKYAHDRGNVLEEERLWREAGALYEQTLQGCGPLAPPDDRIWLLTSLSEMSFNQGLHDDARRWLRYASQAIQDYPKDSPVWIQFLNATAALHLVEGRLSLAEKDLLTVVSTARQIGDQRAFAAALHNLASVEMQTGRLDVAYEHQLKALAIDRDVFGERHESVMRAWISLSTIQGLRGEWRAAEQSLLQALAIAETPEALANYAVVLDHLKRSKEARAIRSRIPLTTASNKVVDINALPFEGQRLRVKTR
jgi:tetratricopeptide (TPR) repeat protein